MAEFDDISGFQVVLTPAGVNNYDPRPKKTYDDISGIQAVFGVSSDITEEYNVAQLGEGKGWYLLRETSTGVWKSAYKIDVNPSASAEVQAMWDAATGLIQVSKLSAQQFMDALAASEELEGAFLEDRSITVDAKDLETNMTIVVVTLTEGNKPIYSFRKI